MEMGLEIVSKKKISEDSTMTKREQIAKTAAKAAALSVYQAVMGAPTKKVAGTQFSSEPSVQYIAKAAAAASYSAVLKVAQMGHVPVDAMNVGHALQKKAPAFYDFIVNEKYKESSEVPFDATTFANWVKAGGDGEAWASAENWPAIAEAVASMISQPEVREGMKNYLLSI